MSDYDGVVWTVADPEPRWPRRPSSARRHPLPEPPDEPLADARTTSAHGRRSATSAGPSCRRPPGVAAGLRCPTVDRRRPRRSSARTSTPARSRCPAGSTRRPTYDGHRPACRRSVTDDELVAAAIATLRRAARSSSCSRRRCATSPPTSSRATTPAGSRWPRSATVRRDGFYDVDQHTPPGHSYGRIAQMLADPDRIVGFEEQYAAAAAVMAQVAELPGPGRRRLRDPRRPLRRRGRRGPASDISAWVEVTGELGWVPVDVTPAAQPRPRDPGGARPSRSPIPNPPPPPPPPPDVDVVTRSELEEPDEEEEDEEEEDRRLVGGGIGLLGVGRRRSGRRSSASSPRSCAVVVG